MHAPVRVVDNGKSVEYDYDYQNRLVRRNDELFVHDGWQIACSLKNGKVEHRYLWGATQDELLAMDDCWTLRDHLNTVRKVVDARGCVISELEYNAFGALVNATGEMPLFRFTGKLFDDVAGLQWNINRWYDANVGRWISEDPIGFNVCNRNFAGYVHNRPLTHSDFWGLVDSDNFIVKYASIAYSVTTTLERKNDNGEVISSTPYTLTPQEEIVVGFNGGDVGYYKWKFVALDAKIYCMEKNGKSVFKILFRPIAYVHAAVIPVDTCSWGFWTLYMDWWLGKFQGIMSGYSSPYSYSDIEGFQQGFLTHENNHVYPFQQAKTLIIEKLGEIENDNEYSTHEAAEMAVTFASQKMLDSLEAAYGHAQMYDYNMDWKKGSFSPNPFPYKPYTASW